MIIKGIKIFVFLVVSGLSCFLKGQELLPVVHDTTLANGQINLFGNALTHSTTLYNEFSRKFIFGGEIKESLANKVWERQKAYNRLGGGYRIRAEYRARNQVVKSKTDWSWMIDFTNEVHLSAEYSDDLIGLGFVGNEAFLGERATISGTNARFTQFLSLGGGLHDRKTKSFVTINLVLPQNYFELEVDKGYFSFSESGDNFTADIEAELIESNSTSHFKGIGAAVNFDFNIPFGSHETFNGFIGITARNLGFYRLHKTTVSTISTSQNFSGFSLNELIGTSSFDGLSDSLGVRESENSKYRLMPGFFQVGKLVSANHPKRVQSFFGIRMYAVKGYKPLIYAGAHYQPIPQFSVGAQGAYGGYGNFRLGLYLNYTSEAFILSIGSEDLLGMISKYQYGHSGLIRISWKL